jgi:amino acid transporter
MAELKRSLTLFDMTMIAIGGTIGSGIFLTPSPIASQVLSAWAVVLVLFWGTFENPISYVVFTDWIFFALGGFSVIVLRRRMPDAPRPYRVPGYPWVPLFFVAMSGWFVATTLVQKPEQARAGLVFLGLGVPVYYYWKGRPRAATTAER